MASSTADTTIFGSIPFSRLIVSITLYSSLAISFCHLALGFSLRSPEPGSLSQHWRVRSHLPPFRPARLGYSFSDLLPLLPVDRHKCLALFNPSDRTVSIRP